MALCGRAAALSVRLHRVSAAATARRCFGDEVKFVVQGFHAVPEIEPPPVSLIGVAHLNKQHFWKWGLSIKHIAELTGKPESDISEELSKQIWAGAPPFVMDLVHNLTSVPEELICPVSGGLFEEPVVGPDGMRYERAAIIACLETDGLSPISGETIDESQLVPAADALMEVLDFKRQCVEKILEYVPVLHSCHRAEAVKALLDRAELFAFQDVDKDQIAKYRAQFAGAAAPSE